MFVQLNINLSEEDYLSFNNFHSFESAHGKKLIRKTRLFFVLAMTEAEQLSALRELQDVICKLEYELDPMLPSSQPGHK